MLSLLGFQNEHNRQKGLQNYYLRQLTMKFSKNLLHIEKEKE